MKRSASPGDEDGPGQKHLAHPTQQVQGASTKKEARTIRSGEVVWSGKLEFHDVHKQKRFLSSCYVHSHEKINTVNWPKQLKMTTISDDDFIKIYDLHVMRPRQLVDFSVDEDCNKMSHRAFIQSTSIPNFGCALLEYTSSGILLLILSSCSCRNEKVTFGFINKYTYQDRVVEFLADFGILSHTATANVHNLAKIARLAKKSATKSAKKIASLQDELQQKDKVMVDQQILHQEEMEIKNKVVEKKSEQLTRIEVEKEALKKERDKDLRKLDTLKKEMERLEKEKEKMLEEQKKLLSKERTKIMAESLRNQERIKKEVKVEQKQKNTQKTRMLRNQLNEIEASRSELESEVRTKQATLDDLKEELMCIICHQPIHSAITLKCGHASCNQCLNKMLDYNVEKPPSCPICRGRLCTLGPSIVIDNCIGIINQHRLEDEARQIGNETETESEGEPIQGEQEVSSQSMSEESGDDPSPVSPSSCESSASSYCRATSSIEDMFSSDSLSDSN